MAHITGPEHHAAARDRARHAMAHLEEAGLALSTGRVHFGGWSEARGRRATDAVLRTAPDTDAFFCGNDQIARGVTYALRGRGIGVPGDIAVVGYDNWDTMALASRPPLTTIDMNLTETGRIAALRLLETIDARETTPGVRTVPCRLVVRESSWRLPHPASLPLARSSTFALRCDVERAGIQSSMSHLIPYVIKARYITV
nr:substrate-binding domain-containing protein [Streptomyces sp. MUSC 14]